MQTFLMGIGAGIILGNIIYYLMHKGWGSKKWTIATSILGAILIILGIIL